MPQVALPLKVQAGRLSGEAHFCGRGVCREHAQSMPCIVDTYRKAAGQSKALIVANTLYCVFCEPKEDSVELPNLP
jgi:hypothetical protein